MSNIINKVSSGLLIIPVRIYQYGISPFTPASCRHVPTCSEYSVQALKLHGAVQGGRMALNRIARCHPWGTEGFDPVPKFIIKKVKLKKEQMRGVTYYDRLKSKIVTLLLLPFFFALVSCNESGKKQQNQDGNKVLVSIVPYKFFVDRIAADHVTTIVLIPPGTTPHVYDPTPRQMVEIGEADIYFHNGHLGFEQAWIGKLKDNHPKLKPVNLSRGIDLISGHQCGDPTHDHGADPHTWLSPRNGKIIAGQIYNALADQYPEFESEFKENLEGLMRDIGELDLEINQMLAGIKTRRFMIFHPSLTYFSRDYNLEQIPVEFEGKEPSPSRLKASVDLARKEGLSAVLIQKEFDAENAAIIAGEIGGKVVQIDPLSENWLKNLQDIAEKIRLSQKPD